MNEVPSPRGVPILPNTDGRVASRYVGISMGEIGDWENGEVVIEGGAPLRDAVLGARGELLGGALLTMCDNVGGWCGGLAAMPDGWVVTTSMMLRRTRAVTTGADLRFRSAVLRKGKTAIVTEVEVHDDVGQFGRATVTSAVLVPEYGVPIWERPASMTATATPDLELETPFYEWLGFEQSDDGACVMEITPSVRNPWGFVHGGVTASLIDSAATWHLEDSALVDATVHYLAPSKVGPMHARGVVLGRSAIGTVVRVEVHDAGADRLTTVAIATVQSVAGS